MDIVATYLRELRDIHASGSAVRETSYYGPLASLLNSVGKSLKPRVRCVVNLQNRGAGIPDGGLFSSDQLQRADGEIRPGQLPSRGVLEVKGAGDDVKRIAASEQVTRYLGTYGQVLVTNYRDFLLMGRDEAGRPQERERFTLAPTEAAFWIAARDPDALAEMQGERLVEYLKRVMLSNAQLTRPQDVAWFLASYARDARARIERADLPALARVRQALEEALGITFAEERGEHFFRSTLIQTLFYGVFSAWVLWHNERPERTDRFDWRVAGHYLHVPVIQALFGQISQPNRLRPLGLTEVMEWTGSALNRVDRTAFFTAFDAGQAVQYFYEPFLEAFDPELRRQLGVWYTPPEVIRYMVARVDAALREELGIADGLADPRVHVLDPCAGTGAYVVEVLRHVAATLREQGEEALLGYRIKQAALTRVFGFELLPAPFVVSHLQVGLLLQQLGAPLRDDEERAKIYLTNALTGWEPPDEARRAYVQQRLEFLPELQEERDSAAQVKREAPILVILGNPPYSGYAGIAQIEEERDLSGAYRTARRAPAPQGQGLNDLYVRFFRMAERRIVDQSGQGVVCYISNYSWLDGLSHTGMRERYLESFDRVWIDSLNGDKYRTGKLTPEGEADPSVFSTEFNAEGIQVGTAIALMVRKGPRAGDATVSFRNFWGRTKRAQLLDALTQPAAHPYLPLDPPAPLGFPLQPSQIAADYLSWPQLPELFPSYFSGVQTKRDDLVIDVDRAELVKRMEQYFDASVSYERMAQICPRSMEETARFDPRATRNYLIKRGFLPDYVRRHFYRPFDMRWIYWEPETRLLGEKSPAYFEQVFEGNVWLAAVQQNRKDYDPPLVSSQLASLHIIERSANLFPLYLRSDGAPRTLFDLETTGDPRELGDGRRLNLSDEVLAYLSGIGSIADAEALFRHTIAALHAPAYRDENAGALRQDWPRVPLPVTREALEASADLGRLLAMLLDSERQVPGVTSEAIRPELRPIAVLTVAGGRQINPDAGDLDLIAGWGFAGRGSITMPARGKVIERVATEAEINPELGVGPGASTYDIYLNDHVYWRNVPPRVWEYTLGGYQVIKKWLSYRERPLLGRGLTPGEAIEVMQIARRIAAILLLEPSLDANYRVVTAAAFPWSAAGSDG